MLNKKSQAPGFIPDRQYYESSTVDWFPTRYTLEDTAKNNKFATEDPYYHDILVGGANAAGKGFFSLSYLPFGVLSRGNHHQLFRHNQTKEIEKAIVKAIEDGKPVRVWGHSWGGATVAKLAKMYPTVNFYALDPVSRFGRLDEIPSNLTIFRPDERYEEINDIPSKLAVTIGGRWPMVPGYDNRYVKYRGGHVAGIDSAVNEQVLREKNNRPANYIAPYKRIALIKRLGEELGVGNAVQPDKGLPLGNDQDISKSIHRNTVSVNMPEKSASISLAAWAKYASVRTA